MRRALAAVVVAILVAAIVMTVASGSAAAGERDSEARRLLVISLPAVSWEDVNDHELPNLNRLLDESAVADLTTRTVTRATRLGDGYLTLGAGTRSLGMESGTRSDGQAFEVGERFGADTAAQVYRRRTGRSAGDGLVYLDIGQVAERNRAELFGAEIGALGDALAGAGWSRAVIANGDGIDVEDVQGGYYRRQAVTALMGSRGRVPTGAVGPELLMPDPDAPFGLRYDMDAVLSAFRSVWRDRSVVLVEGSDLVREDAYRQFATPEQRARLFVQALRRTDDLVGRLLREVDPRRDAVMVVGPSPPLRANVLTIAALRGPGVDPGLLRSGTTRRSGFVQLIDMAPTILDQVGIDRPDSMEGRAAEVGRGGGSAADRRAFVEDANAAAEFRDAQLPAVTTVFVVVQILLVLGMLVWLERPAWRRVPAILRVGALAALAFFPAILLARTVPFHEIGAAAYWAWIVGVTALVTGAYVLVRRRDELLPVTLALGVIAGLLVFDVLIGTPLQFNNPIGYSPTVAGRFSGFGNLGYAAVASSTLLLAGLLAHRRGGRRGAWTAVVLLAVVFVVDGTPFWGADVGGVLSILPAYAVAGYLLLGLRVRLRTVLLCAAAVLAAVLVFATIDLSRPPEKRTHLGRLFETTESRGWSGFWTVIQRKLSENLDVLFTSIWLIIVVAVLALLGYVYVRHRERLHAVPQQVPEMRAVLVGFAILAALGFALNDSGIAIPGMMLAVLNPVLITLFVMPRRRAPSPPEGEPAVPERAPVGTRA